MAQQLLDLAAQPLALGFRFTSAATGRIIPDMPVTWRTIDDPATYVQQVLAEEAEDIPASLIQANPWYCDALDLAGLDINQEMVADQDTRPVHMARRDRFVDRILAREPIPPLIALGPTLHLVDGYARYRALRHLGITEARVLRQDIRPNIQDFLATVRKWAGSRPDLLAVLLVGSHARGTATPDSDVDLVLITDQPTAFLDDQAWADVFGDVRRIDREDWGTVQSLRVFYADGLEVEFGVTTRDWLETDPVDEGTRRIIADGAQVLSDPLGLATRAVDAITAGS